jgi:hypothetical protein
MPVPLNERTLLKPSFRHGASFRARERRRCESDCTLGFSRRQVRSSNVGCSRSPSVQDGLAVLAVIALRQIPDASRCIFCQQASTSVQISETLWSILVHDWFPLKEFSDRMPEGTQAVSYMSRRGNETDANTLVIKTEFEGEVTIKWPGQATTCR